MTCSGARPGRLDAYEYGAQYTPLPQRSGLTSLHQLAEVVVFRTARDYEQWLGRMNTLDQYVEQNIALMREGVQRGIVPPQVIMQRVPGQIAKQIVQDPTLSPFYEVFRKMPDSIPAGDRERLQAEARTAIATKIVPAYQRLQQFVEQEYLPKSRATVGLWDTPEGEAALRGARRGSTRRPT